MNYNIIKLIMKQKHQKKIHISRKNTAYYWWFKIINNNNNYSDNYSKISGSLLQHCKDVPAANNNDNIVDFNGSNATDSFNFKTKITGQTNDDTEINNFEIKVQLKCLNNFWRTLEMPLINCEVNLILTWSANCVIIYTDIANQIPTFTITEINL